MTNILISIKPKYSQQIFAGTKTIELRKQRFLGIEEGNLAYVYESNPTKAVVGWFRIDQVLSSTDFFDVSFEEYLQKFWDTWKEILGIEKEAYFEYYKGARIHSALFVKDPVSFSNPLPLQSMKDLGMVPPQSFYYSQGFDDEILRELS